MDLKAEHFERQVSTVERERDNWEKKYEVRKSNQWFASAHAPFVYRIFARNTKRPSQSSKALFPAWKGCDHTAPLMCK